MKRSLDFGRQQLSRQELSNYNQNSEEKPTNTIDDIRQSKPKAGDDRKQPAATCILSLVFGFHNPIPALFTAPFLIMFLVELTILRFHLCGNLGKHGEHLRDATEIVPVIAPLPF